MTDKHKADRSDSKVEGEGSYSATADYNKRTADFLKKGKVDEAAREARRARLERRCRAQGGRSQGQGRRYFKTSPLMISPSTTGTVAPLGV